jgi:xylan 1,4-beta-xylosidase
MKNIIIDAKKTGQDLDIGRFGLGQGGLSKEPMIDHHIQEIRNLGVKIIRLFLQEYFHPYPKHGIYDWTLMDRAVDAIIATGAKPLMCICFKPKILFPKIDHNIVNPNSWKEWDDLIYQMVRHYKVEKKYDIKYWEVANEPNIGEMGGCPYYFTEKNYPEYYEHTVKAVRRADPKAKVGGPALAGWENRPLFPALLEHCSKKNVPIDFVSWHDYNDDPEYFKKSIIYMKNILKKYPKLKCETAIDEWNVTLFNSLMKHAALPEYQPCFVVDMVNHMVEQGLSFCCFYHIRSVNGPRETYDFLSQNGQIIATDGQNYGFNLLGLFDYQGIVRPAYFSFKMLSRLLGKQLKVNSPGGNIKVLAAYDKDFKMVNALIWNFAVENPKKEKISLKIINAEKGDWRYTRYLLDAKTASNEEDRRLKVVARETPKQTSEIKETFELEPYGLTQINFKKSMRLDD